MARAEQTHKTLEDARRAYRSAYVDYKCTTDKLTYWTVGESLPFCWHIKRDRLNRAWDAFVSADNADYTAHTREGNNGRGKGQ